MAGLNQAQQAAALHTEGPAMIIAGAGSGKTRVLTFRLAYLIATRKASAWELLALTFTNKAAREMRQRIELLVGPDARNISMGTFHSVFSRMLRAEATKIGYTSDFSIYDSDDSRSLITRILKELNKDDKRFKPRAIQAEISLAKNDLIGPETFAQKLVNDEFKDVAAKVYNVYQNRLLLSNAMDFDDLLFNTATLLKTHADALYKYQHKWKYIMVDEYQDTNGAQYYITKKLAAVHENLTVVGDDAQSIYSFRGANIRNILNFRHDYPDLRLFKLEQNYRSTGNIVQAANSVIANNVDQIPKQVFTANAAGEQIRLIRAQNEQEEALRVVDAIREQRQVHTLSNKAFAVLYRTNAQSRAIEDALRRAGIPYKIFGGLSFYARKEIKDVLAYLKLAVNPTDEEALKRVVNYPARGIGERTIESILTAAKDRGVTAWDVVADADNFADYIGRGRSTVQEFANLIKAFQRQAASHNAADVVAYVAKHSGILKDLHQENTTESLSRWENVQELINAASEYTDRRLLENESPSLSEFLQEVLLLTDTRQEGDDNHVSLMTIHSAKGLEFKAVFVVGLEEGLFPSNMNMNDRSQLEEERRLFYVAITRAERHLCLSFAESRLYFGNRTRSKPSRFLEEIPEAYFEAQAKRALTASDVPNVRLRERQDERPGNLPVATEAKQSSQGLGNLPPRPAPRSPTKLTPLQAASITHQQPTTPEADLCGLAIGVRVEHNKFGIGTVVDLKDDRMLIDFPGKPNTTLLLKFARLRVLG